MERLLSVLGASEHAHQTGVVPKLRKLVQCKYRRAAQPETPKCAPIFWWAKLMGVVKHGACDDLAFCEAVALCRCNITVQTEVRLELAQRDVGCQ